MTAENEKTSSRIPDFSSREEEAKFWDTHDITDYLDELTPVTVRVAKNLSHGLTIRLDPQTLERLRGLAEEKGVGPTTLIRMWILERIKAEHRAQP